MPNIQFTISFITASPNSFTNNAYEYAVSAFVVANEFEIMVLQRKRTLILNKGPHKGKCAPFKFNGRDLLYITTKITVHHLPQIGFLILVNCLASADKI